MTRFSGLALTLLLVAGCDSAPPDPGGDDAGPSADAGDPSVDGGASSVDGGAPGIDAGDLADGGALADAGPGTPRDVLEPGQPVVVGTGCNPPALLRLDDIPDDPSLQDDDDRVVAVFEVDGDALVGKWVGDVAAAEGAMHLWREVVLRIPLNQRLDLVQFEMFSGGSQAAYFSRRGNINTERYGLMIGFHVDNLADGEPGDICAPLEPRRHTFDWSLVHEFGHLVGWVDGSWDRFLDTFEDVRGEGLGYPEDGSPVLDRDFVTSYAERADGDEDHAETFTTFVMLDLDAIAPPVAGEPLAMTKLRWMSEQPNLLALRQAIRITEPDGGDATVLPAPRLFAAHQPEVTPPAPLHGVWEGDLEGEPGARLRVEITADDVRYTRVVNGVAEAPTGPRLVHAAGTFVRLDESFHEAVYAMVWTTGSGDDERVYDDNFLFEGSPTDPIRWSRGESSAELHPAP